MVNTLQRWEQSFARTLNVAFFYRALLYLILTIYAFVLLPIDQDQPLFPNPLWFGIHILVITGLTLLSQANYPNHFTSREIVQRYTLAIIPPSLFFIAIKQRWNDLKILIKRDEYGSLLLMLVLASMALSLVIFVSLFFVLITEFNLGYTLFYLVYTWLVLLPAIVIDTHTYWKNQSAREFPLHAKWEQASITGEQRAVYRPWFVTFLDTKRKRFWLLVTLSLIYTFVVRSQSEFLPITR